MSTGAEKVRENRIRRAVERRGAILSKSRRQDPYAWDYGWTMTCHRDIGRSVPSGRLTLEQVEQWLREGGGDEVMNERHAASATLQEIDDYHFRQAEILVHRWQEMQYEYGQHHDFRSPSWGEDLIEAIRTLLARKLRDEYPPWSPKLRKHDEDMIFIDHEINEQLREEFGDLFGEEEEGGEK